MNTTNALVKTAGCISIAASVLLVLSEPAFGVCNLPRPRLVRAEYSQSDAVVIARLTKSRHIYPKDDLDYHLYSFEVEKTLRGGIPKQFVLWEENSSARLAFYILRGRRYLLFLNRWGEKGWWTADGCANSGEVSKRARTLRQIQDVASLRNARITGEVAFDSVTPAANATVVAIRKSDGKRFETRTHAGGVFDLYVPAGEYSVKVKAGSKSFVTHWLSYEAAESVELENGGCAQIEFVPSDSEDALSAPKRR